MSWTGDLGTESGVTTARCDLKKLFGEWISHDDWLDGPGEPGVAEAADGLADAGGFEFAEEVADYAEDEAEEAEGAEEVARDEFRPADPFTVDWRPQIFVPGTLHVLHNITNVLRKALRGWKDWIVQLRNLSRFLARPWSRDRLVSTCYSAGPHDRHAKAFDGFSSTVYEGRWGEALEAVKDLLPLRSILQDGWSLRRYLYGGVQDLQYRDLS